MIQSVYRGLVTDARRRIETHVIELTAFDRQQTREVSCVFDQFSQRHHDRGPSDFEWIILALGLP
jgi:hypothetical protein